MGKIKLLVIIGISLSLLTGATVLASPFTAETPHYITDEFKLVNCPCSASSDEQEEWDLEWTPGGGGSGGGSSGGGSGGGGSGDGGGSGGGSGSGDSSGDGNSSDNEDNSDECDNHDKCPACNDCIDCGSNPNQCHDCCDDGRRCDDCIHCTFDIGMNDGQLQYTGYGLLDFNGGIINKGETAEGYWKYSYAPITRTGAALDYSGLPLQVGDYRVFGIYNNGIYSNSKSALLRVVPAPLTIDIEFISNTKIYDGNTDISIYSAELSGILADDMISLSTEGVASYASSNVGKDIPIIFTDFEIFGANSRNYYLIQPDGYYADIERAVYSGSISVVVNDDPLRIGSELSFTADNDPSDYLVQWLVDDEDIAGETDITYTVRADDVDKKISVKLISPCRNYEAESPPTAYIPYTIIVSPKDVPAPMTADYVFFGSHGNYTAYAASKDNGFVDIDYILQNSSLGTDKIEYTGGEISAVTSPGTGKSRYFANPADAANGVIRLRAAFYHRGVSVTPSDSYSFSLIKCGMIANETHKIRVSNIGNAPTGNLTIGKSGASPDAFTTTASIINSLDPNQSFDFDIGLSNASPISSSGGITYTASIVVSGENIITRVIPVSIRYEHDYSSWEHRGGYHERVCKSCGVVERANCDYAGWTVIGDHTAHQRICRVCTGVDSHSPSWGTTFINIDSSNHRRTCTICNQSQNVNHTWGSWSAWSAGTSTHHTQTRTCTAAGCGASETNSHAHTWAAHDGTHHRCPTCGHLEGHNWNPWIRIENWADGGRCSRTCRVCDNTQVEYHSIELTYLGIGSVLNHTSYHGHRIRCTKVCGYDTSNLCVFNAANSSGRCHGWNGGSSYNLRLGGCGAQWSPSPNWIRTS